MSYLVIDVGGTYTKYAVMTKECEFLEKGKIPSVRAPLEAFIESIVDIFEMYREQAEGIALSMPGIIDGKNGFMYTGGMIECISNINIVELLTKRCHVPVTVENDAKCAGMAEVWRGALKECKNAVVMVIGTGVGGAVIQNRKILYGKHFMAGEFSYYMTESRSPCSMENAFGFTSGVGGLMKLASEKLGIAEEELSGERVFSMANCGDEKAMEAIREFARGIALQISNYQFILDPERIAIGGGISVQPLFLQMIKEELKKINRIYEAWSIPIPEVVTCEFFNDSNLIGALYVHLCAKEVQLDEEQMKEFLNLIKNRREGRYLSELLSN
ncbi:MAG: ROK family protein [Hespellia sp.]|nr:ROK family protein [Hespellia sp.]